MTIKEQIANQIADRITQARINVLVEIEGQAYQVMDDLTATDAAVERILEEGYVNGADDDADEQIDDLLEEKGRGFFLDFIDQEEIELTIDGKDLYAYRVVQ